MTNEDNTNNKSTITEEQAKAIIEAQKQKDNETLAEANRKIKELAEQNNKLLADKTEKEEIKRQELLAELKDDEYKDEPLAVLEKLAKLKRGLKGTKPAERFPPQVEADKNKGKENLIGSYDYKKKEWVTYD